MKPFISLSIILISSFFYTVTSSAQKDFTREAEDEFIKEGYYNAIELYKKAFTKEKNPEKKAMILFKIGECFRLTEDSKESLVWYEKAIKADYPDPLAILYYADAIRSDGKYDEALMQYKNYLEKVPDDARGKNGSLSCELAQKWSDNPSRFSVQNESMLNSPSYDFSPTFADKKNTTLIFSSSREGSTGKQISDRTGENPADLYYSVRDAKGKWSAPVLLSQPLNSDKEEGAAILNSKKTYMYFTRCQPEAEKSKVMICHIYGAKKSGQRWDGIDLIEVAPDSINVGFPALAENENLMIFTADNMADGAGKRDLWYSKYDTQKKRWMNPVNLGPEINTTGNEMFPYVHEDGSLYFASDGHIGMGQLDIFRAPKISSGKWGKPENLKAPINSAKSDFGIIFEEKDTKGFFTSDRPGGAGDDDIYSFFVPPIIFVLQGTITDADTKGPIENAKVRITGTDGSITETKTDKKGFYVFNSKPGKVNARCINENTTYEIFVSKEKYLNSKENETTIGIEKSTTFVHDFILQNISIPSRELRFPEVLYDLNKWDLRPESKDSLNFLYQLMMDNPSIVIELSAHTDSRASDEYNLDLSQKRAESCVSYLIEKGIPADRMVAKGYGESRLLLSDAQIAKIKSEVEKEADHQKNRRTVFSVLKNDYQVKQK